MNRRHFLAGLSTTAVAASVGGCLGGALGGDSGPIKEITTQGTSLIVSFSEDSDIQLVSLITSDGQQFNADRLAPGEYRGAIGLLSTSYAGIEYAYTPGAYTLVAVDSDGTEYEREITIRPNSSITGVSFLRDQWAGTYDEYRRYTAPVVTIDNTAADSSDVILGPDVIVNSAVLGPNVPLATDPTHDKDRTAELIPLGKNTSSSLLVIDAHTTQSAVTRYTPFAFPLHEGNYGDETAIQQQWGGKTVSASVELTSYVSPSTQFSVKYAGNVQKLLFLMSPDMFYFDNSKIVKSKKQPEN